MGAGGEEVEVFVEFQELEHEELFVLFEVQILFPDVKTDSFLLKPKPSAPGSQ